MLLCWDELEMEYKVDIWELAGKMKWNLEWKIDASWIKWKCEIIFLPGFFFLLFNFF